MEVCKEKAFEVTEADRKSGKKNECTVHAKKIHFKRIVKKLYYFKHNWSAVMVTAQDCARTGWARMSWDDWKWLSILGTSVNRMFCSVWHKDKKATRKTERKMNRAADEKRREWEDGQRTPQVMPWNGCQKAVEGSMKLANEKNQHVQTTANWTRQKQVGERKWKKPERKLFFLLLRKPLTIIVCKNKSKKMIEYLLISGTI